MTDSNKQGIITLVKSAITGKKLNLLQDFDFKFALNIAKIHQISGLIYFGAINCGVDNNRPDIKKLFIMVCQSIVISQQQMYEIERIITAFDENKVEYMLLKGTNLKKIYPKTEMRIMGDADILIKTEQYEIIKLVMENLGFINVTESDHELIWRKNSLLVELHKRLMPSYNKDYYAYYGDGWQLGKPTLEYPTRYEMSKEDQMIYLFTHFSKHYRDGGIGIRHFTDLFVYRSANTNMDEEYIRKELEKLCLYDFYINILDTLGVWFEDKEPNDKTDYITNVIFDSGVYGKHSKIRIAQTLRTAKQTSNLKNAKIKHYMHVIFPSMEYMLLYYSFLKKYPFLLPVTWAMRFFDILINNRKRALCFYKDMKQISNEDILNYEKSLHFVGLDFNFKE